MLLGVSNILRMFHGVSKTVRMLTQQTETLYDLALMDQCEALEDRMDTGPSANHRKPSVWMR
ncbi:hypothetical protein chiPu_0031646, partial [Chiloscyllium punctatum]|nr:hypothetical protein [Chiloscyllium punctatum]